ncbi:MAG: TIGR02221 family CRISPR-associated protein [Chloroflexota bacterium]|nr:TIGR02221 family CRISPR-associated protein [Chloroflexota bacterium]
MRKIVTFLGKYPKETQYLYDDSVYTGRVFGEALRQFVAFDEMLVFTTAEAAHTTWPILAALDDPRIRKVAIPIGHDTDELWTLFEKLTEEVAPGDTVIFDITHGLRSIPFLVFLAAAYLKEAREVHIEKIYYGAYELGQPAPVIDLSKFIALLDWLTATNQFIHTGNGRYLAKLLQDAGHFEHPRRALTPEEHEQKVAAKRIGDAAGAITETSQALLTNLIPHAEQVSANLLARLTEAREDLARQAPPYRLLADRVRATYQPFAVAHPLTDDLRHDLDVQLLMIAWYMEKGHLPQAFTLMREWIVTAVGYRLGIDGDDILDFRGKRREVEFALGKNCALWRQSPEPVQTPPQMVAALRELIDTKELADFWNRVSDFRNFLNHGAMRPHWEQRPVKTVMKSSKTIYERFRSLAEELLEDTPCSS